MFQYIAAILVGFVFWSVFFWYWGAGDDCKHSTYSLSTMTHPLYCTRLDVPATRTDWQTEWENYTPAPALLSNINDTSEFKNPLGRTGLYGKGLLPSDGPNRMNVLVLLSFSVGENDTPHVLVHRKLNNLPCYFPEVDAHFFDKNIRTIFRKDSDCNQTLNCREVLFDEQDIQHYMNTDSAWVQLKTYLCLCDDEVEFKRSKLYTWEPLDPLKSGRCHVFSNYVCVLNVPERRF